MASSDAYNDSTIILSARLRRTFVPRPVVDRDGINNNGRPPTSLICGYFFFVSMDKHLKSFCNDSSNLMAFSLSVTDDGEEAPPAGRRWAMTLVIGGGERSARARGRRIRWVFAFERTKIYSTRFINAHRRKHSARQHTVNLGAFGKYAPMAF